MPVNPSFWTYDFCLFVISISAVVFACAVAVGGSAYCCGQRRCSDNNRAFVPQLTPPGRPEWLDCQQRRVEKPKKSRYQSRRPKRIYRHLLEDRMYHELECGSHDEAMRTRNDIGNQKRRIVPRPNVAIRTNGTKVLIIPTLSPCAEFLQAKLSGGPTQREAVLQSCRDRLYSERSITDALITLEVEEVGKNLALPVKWRLL